MPGVRPGAAKYTDYRRGRRHFPTDVSTGSRFKRRHTPAHFRGVRSMVPMDVQEHGSINRLEPETRGGEIRRAFHFALDKQVCQCYIDN